MTRMNNKTKLSDQSVDSFIDSLDSSEKQQDSRVLVEMMQRVSGDEPRMWGTIVGFGSYHYKYATGRENDWALLGFSPRKVNLTVYVMEGFDEHQDLLKKLGTYTNSVSCLYIKKLADVDVDVLEKIIRQSYKTMISGKLAHVTSVTTTNKEV